MNVVLFKPNPQKGKKTKISQGRLLLFQSRQKTDQIFYLLFIITPTRLNKRTSNRA